MKNKYISPVFEIDTFIIDDVVALSLQEEGVGEEGDEE